MTDGLIRGGVRYSAKYDPDSRAKETGFDSNIEKDMAIAKVVSEILVNHYSGHLWQVRACHRQGIVQIRLPFMPEGKCYVLHIKDLEASPFASLLVMQAGGEVLERFNIPRSNMNFEGVLGRTKVLSKQEIEDACKR